MRLEPGPGEVLGVAAENPLSRVSLRSGAVWRGPAGVACRARPLVRVLGTCCGSGGGEAEQPRGLCLPRAMHAHEARLSGGRSLCTLSLFTPDARSSSGLL